MGVRTMHDRHAARGGSGATTVAGVAAWVREWATHLDPELDRDPTQDLDERSRAIARRLLAGHDLTGAREPTAVAYDEVVVLGAAASGILRRLTFVRDRRITAPMLTILAGHRSHLGAAGGGRDGDADALLASDGRFAASSEWRAPTVLRDTDTTRAADEDAWARARHLFPDETALALLLLDRTWPAAPGAEAPTTRLPDGRTVVGEVRVPVEHVPLLEVANPGAPFGVLRVLDAPAVPRTTGAARPTTASTLTEWARMTAGDTAGRTLVVSSQPHVLRARQTMDRIAQRFGWAPDAFEVVGPEATPHVRLGLLLREAVDVASDPTSGTTPDPTLAG